jgi:Lon protease-like protein
MKLPEIIPLFPLANVVLFPRMALPLHVFEPRYRAMVGDAARGAHLIGMVLLRGEWQQDYEGRPPIFGTGTVGEMLRVAELPDGRFDIVLRGVREYVIVEERIGQPYREAVVRWREPGVCAVSPAARARVTGLVRRYLARRGQEADPEALVHGRLDDETFINFLAQHLDLPPIAKQALLEAGSVPERATRLVEVLEFEELRFGSAGVPERAQ